MSDTAHSVADMLDAIELPKPEDVGALDDLGLVDAMAVATVVERAAIQVRIAAMREIYERQLRAPVPSRPPQSASRRRARRRRKQRRRR
jgi:hypothetical protein